MAQLVARLVRNEKVPGSIPGGGPIESAGNRGKRPKYRPPGKCSKDQQMPSIPNLLGVHLTKGGGIGENPDTKRVEKSGAPEAYGWRRRCLSAQAATVENNSLGTASGVWHIPGNRARKFVQRNPKLVDKLSIKSEQFRIHEKALFAEPSRYDK